MAGAVQLAAEARRKTGSGRKKQETRDLDPAAIKKKLQRQ